MKTPRVAIYARQSVKADDGIENQISEATADAERRGWQVVDRYIDNNVSATKERGAGTEWARMLQDIDRGRVDAVMVTAVDRLMRRVVDVLELREPKRRVRVVVVRGGIDTAEPMGNFIIGLFALVAEQEIETKATRALPYREERRAAGHPSPGRVPYGFRWVPKLKRQERGSDIRFEVVPEEAEVIRWMFREVLSTDDERNTIYAICKRLNEDGKLTRDGKRWGSSTVRRMLLSPFYAGLLPERQEGCHYKPEAVNLEKCSLGAWDAIVSVDELRAVRARLLDPSRLTHGGNQRQWLLSGIARCGVCGGPVRACKTREGYHGYKCSDAMHFQRRGDFVDRYVENVVIDRLSAPDAASLVSPAPGIDAAALAARLASLDAQRDGLLDFIGTWTKKKILGRLAPIDAEMDQVRAELASAAALDPVSALVGAEDVRAVWDSFTVARKQAVLSRLYVPVLSRVGKGRAVIRVEDAAASVSMIERTAHRSNVALPTLISEAENHSPLSAEVREALAVLLA